jgi:hypothetical protein
MPGFITAHCHANTPVQFDPYRHFNHHPDTLFGHANLYINSRRVEHLHADLHTYRFGADEHAHEYTRRGNADRHITCTHPNKHIIGAYVNQYTNVYTYPNASPRFIEM